MLRNDDELWVIEMTFVSPPYVLDFAGAYLDDFPDYSEDVLAEKELERKEQFGENWHKVRLVVLELEQHGIYLVDVNPNNIRTTSD